MAEKAIIIGGVARSGTTLMQHLLDRHSRIAAFGESKLATEEIFREFPRWVAAAPCRERPRLVAIYKEVCLKRFFKRRLFRRKSAFDKAWKTADRIWMGRFENPSSWWWRNPLAAAAEWIWLRAPVQRRHFGPIPSDPLSAGKAGFRGLHRFFTSEDIAGHFDLLDGLECAQNLDEACRAYGRFWDAVFSERAAALGKTLWAEKTPNNTRFGTFFARCFGEVKLLNLVRDGRDVAVSAVKRWGGPYEKALENWAGGLKAVADDQRLLPPDSFLNVRYEDLVRKKRETLEHVTEFLGVGFERGMLEVETPDTSIGNYEKVFTPEMKRFALDRYGALLAEWGYRS